MYKQVLKFDPKNIWAANGVGAVLAHKGLLNEARDIFAQVREATADFSDVWLNIAHILVDQRQYIRAIQMYENCAKKFSKHTNVEVLLYLARAFCKANKLADCKQMLLKARHVAPEDTVFMYNLALVQQRLSKQILQNDKSNLKTVQNAVHDLEIASRTFVWLGSSTEIDRTKFEFKYDFKNESRICQDLLNQASYHLTRAKILDEEEKELKRKQEAQIRELKEKQQFEQKLKEDEQKQKELALIEKRAEFVKKTQNFTNFQVEEKAEKKGSSKKRSKKEVTDFVTDGSDSDGKETDPGAKTSKSKSKSAKTKRRKTADFVEENDNENSNSASQDQFQQEDKNKKKTKSRM